MDTMKMPLQFATCLEACFGVATCSKGGVERYGQVASMLFARFLNMGVGICDNNGYKCALDDND